MRCQPLKKQIVNKSDRFCLLLVDNQLTIFAPLITEKMVKRNREARGAFVCEYAVFKEIYNLQLRSLERTSTTIFLALLMVSSVGQEDMNPLKLDDIMKQLLEVLRFSLRKGDIITHYTASQYALLLPLKSYDNGKLVMERALPRRKFIFPPATASAPCASRAR